MSYEKLSAPFDSDFPDEWYQYNLDHHFWFAWRLRVLQRLLKDNRVNTSASWKGLDIGSGVAFFRSQIEAVTKWTVDAADLNEPALQKAKPGRGKTLLYNIEDQRLDLKDYYDLIFMFDVLEHIKEPTRFLEAALWHLRSGGFVLINVPALRCLYSRYDQLVGHFVRYQTATMRKLLESPPCSLKIVDLRYWGFSLLPIAGLRSLMVRTKKTPDQAVAAGFKISAGWVNQAFLTASRIETSALSHPPAGTSLMALATKP